jgi:hypothetical protein
VTWFVATNLHRHFHEGVFDLNRISGPDAAVIVMPFHFFCSDVKGSGCVLMIFKLIAVGYV